MSNGRPNSSPSLSILILTGENSSPLEAAFLQVLGNPEWLRKRDFDGKFGDRTVADISVAWRTHKPHLLIATSREAWNVFRLLNLWRNQPRVFGPRAVVDSEPPVVLAFPGLCDNSLADCLAAATWTDSEWLKCFVDRCWQELANKEQSFAQQISFLQKAVIAAVGTQARHTIKLANGRSDHGRNDVIAAIRIVQGAVLEKMISPAEGQRACRKILLLARQSGLGAKPASRSGQTRFFGLAAKFLGSPKVQPSKLLGTFASLLVVDDQGFWAQPMGSVWKRMGFECRIASNKVQIATLMEHGRKPVRVILLDMQLGNDMLGGAKLLPLLKEKFEGTPVVALSVDDRFSEAVFLKRMGLFAYVNKHALAEPHQGRDSVSAFRQLEDAIRAAAFASLANDLRSFFEAIVNGWMMTTRIESEHDSSGATEQKWAAACGHIFDAFESAANSALNVLSAECARLFHGYWQGTPHSAGLAYRQIIRAFGIVNDKWCSLWTEWRFNPDMGRQFWCEPKNVEFPCRAYHKITTAIRGQASHGMVEDKDFQWSDVWIMILTLVLKMEGTCRGYLDLWARNNPSALARYSEELSTCVRILARSLEGLMQREFVLKGQSMAKLAGLLERRLNSHWFGSLPRNLAEGDEKLLSVLPYFESKEATPIPGGEGASDVKQPVLSRGGWSLIHKDLIPVHRLLLGLMLHRIPSGPFS